MADIEKMREIFEEVLQVLNRNGVRNFNEPITDCKEVIEFRARFNEAATYQISTDETIVRAKNAIYELIEIFANQRYTVVNNHFSVDGSVLTETDLMERIKKALADSQRGFKLNSIS